MTSAALAQNRDIATTESAKRIPRVRFNDDGAESRLGRLIHDTNTEEKKTSSRKKREGEEKGVPNLDEVLFNGGGRSILTVRVRPKESYYANGADNRGDA
jgi:hypothetical protein